jgi:hypothetical protein
MSIILRNLAFAIGMLAGVIELRGQGGPPMITDDPGTPGPNKWEINLAVAWAHRPAETSLDLPAIDLNYGLGERIQLTLQTAPVLLKRRERAGPGVPGSSVIIGGPPCPRSSMTPDSVPIANARLRKMIDIVLNALSKPAFAERSG